MDRYRLFYRDKEVQVMGTFEIEFATFRRVRIEAGSIEEARDKVAAMDDETIERLSDFEGYDIWDGPKEVVGAGHGQE